MSECVTKTPATKCSCSYGSCSRKGKCCACIAYHRRGGEMPACFFPPDVERTYDRSIEMFINTFKERGKWW